MYLRALAVFRAVGAIIVEAEDPNVALLLEPMRVVLKAKFSVIDHLEVGGFAVQAPDDGTVGAVDFVFCGWRRRHTWKSCSYLGDPCRQSCCGSIPTHQMS